MPDRSDADLVRLLYEVIAGSSAENLAGLLDPDVQWHVPGSNPRSGTYSGRDATMELLRTRRSHPFRLLDVLTGERYVMAFVAHRIDRDGQTTDARFVHVLRMSEGHIIESWHFDQDQAGLDEFLNRVVDY